MLNRLMICIALLASLVSSAMAQDMHVFSNGTVADADKINDNFAAVDQTGPDISFGARVVGADGLKGSVTVTISDPSGLFGYGKGQCYPCASDSPWRAEDQKLLFEAETTISVDEEVYANLNEVTTLVFYATDLRGNKSVRKTEYAGPTSRIRSGLYKAREPIAAWQPLQCGTSSSLPPQVPIRYVNVLVGVPDGEAYPSLKVFTVSMCEEAYEDLWSFGQCKEFQRYIFHHSDSESSRIPISPDDESLSINLEINGDLLTSSLGYSPDSSEMSFVIEERCNSDGPSSGNGQGPYSMTLDRVERP